jgi:anti-sigma B factor antagonist
VNSSSPFDLTIEQRGKAVHVVLTGELDISTAQRLEDDLRRIEADQPALIVLDLQQLSFMDSTGLRLLITADTRARADGRKLAIVKGSDMVQRVMRLTRLDERLTIVADASALAEA